ncbi:MAG: c-type cytochrome [Planctomycetota bacterium]|nr:c-type cytochrome [Planctomycetota bacterium]
MDVRTRQLFLALLVAIFCMQTWRVYSDPLGRLQSLSPLALEGQAVWRDHNCQSCHQIYGFGGFLGPDLTNAIDLISPERLTAILTDGAGQMPAFGLDAPAREAVAAFLGELDETGVAQAVLGEVVAPADLLRGLVESTGDLGESAARGWEIVAAQGCIGCHLPNGQSLHLATDLTAMAEQVEPARLFGVLRDGIPPTAMPRLGLDDEDCEAVLAFLGWLGEHGEGIRARFESRATSDELLLSEIPWFEFE